MAWLKEPLLYFLVLSACIFGLYRLVGPNSPAETEIVVSQDRQQRLIASFARTWLRPPTAEELDDVITEWVRDEIAYRQGLDMGLDTDDAIIRRRLRQKFELLAEGVVSVRQPTTAELETYLLQNQSAYTRESVFSLQQLYFNADARGAAVEQDAERAKQLLETSLSPTDLDSLGDRISLPRRVLDQREGELERLFGGAFVQQLDTKLTDQWQGPLMSGYGLHLVYIEEYSPGRPLTFEEAEPQLRRDWALDQRMLAIDTLYEELRHFYRITVEPLSSSEPAS